MDKQQVIIIEIIETIWIIFSKGLGQGTNKE